jgi:hypothetical protein
MKENTMKRIKLLSVGLILSFASFNVAADLNGKWSSKMQGPEGDMEMIFIFKVNTDTLTGTVQGPMGDMPISKGKVNGDQFSFDVSFGDMTINHQCKVMGDSILMKVPGMQGEEMNMILKRQVDKK